MTGWRHVEIVDVVCWFAGDNELPVPLYDLLVAEAGRLRLAARHPLNPYRFVCRERLARIGAAVSGDRHV